MKKNMRSKISIFIVLFICTCIALPSHSKTRSVKTSYKRYSIIKYKDEDILCEPYTVQKNDWLYKILRNKGEISEKDFPRFINIFKEINPDISNIDAIHSGDAILIPLKNVNKEDYNLSALENVDVPVVKLSTSDENPDSDEDKLNEQKNKTNKIEAYKLARLKKYSSLIGGILLNKGKIYFPGKNNSTQFIDLSTVPVIETKQGERILITTDDTLSDELLENIESYWKNLKTQSLFDALEKVKDTDNSVAEVNTTLKNKKIIQSLLLQAGFEYLPDTKIQFTIQNINLEAYFGRVIRKDTTDLLINFGNVYGSALEDLEKQKYKIISITPELKLTDVIDLLFSHLGYATWENPSFSKENQVEKIIGLYAAKEEDKLFIPTEPLSTSAIDYLQKENIKILSID